MPAKAPAINDASLQILSQIAHGIRARRKAFGISMVVAAHAAGVSRVTWHRIENAEASVTMGAYVGAMNALGLDIELRQAISAKEKMFEAVLPESTDEAQGIPAFISIQNYPQLRQIAWHVKDGFELTPAEAFGLYDRYRRHLDIDQMEPQELKLFKALENATMGQHHAV